MNMMNHKSTRNCAICGSKEKNMLYSQRFSTLSGFSLLDSYNVVVCNNCGFCFSDNIPDQKVFDIYYKEMSKYEDENKDSKPNEYDLAKFAIIASTIESYLQDKKTNILEIGCANGHLLSLLKPHGFLNVSGVDPSPASAKAAFQLYGITVLTNALSDVKMNEHSIDFLILAGVLEHVRDLDAVLLKLNRMLALHGGICVVVPDASRYAQGEDAPFQEFSTEHINFFGPTSLTNLMCNYGFSQALCQQSLVEPSYRTKTPIIQAIYRKEEDADILCHSKFITDIDTKSGLVSYITQSHHADNHIFTIINGIVDSGRPVIIWGTGALTLRLLANSRLAETKITAFVDSNPHYQGKKLNNIPIIAPGDLKGHDEAILVASRVYQQEIANIIRNELNLRNELLTLFDL
jgi:SAM-dependent methyltransferase